MRQKERVLVLAGWLSGAIAALHVVIVFLGAPAYRYFGAGEDMARQAEAGSLIPAAMTLVIAAVFGVFALYAFAGAGRFRRLPLLRVGLAAISAIYLVRGLSLLKELALFAQDSGAVPARYLAFSFTSLVIGLFYLAGTVLLWPRLGARREATEAWQDARQNPWRGQFRLFRNSNKRRAAGPPTDSPSA